MDEAGAVIPVAADPAERMTCEDQFPDGGFPEIWLNVFDKLDRTDKLAFSGASSVWHDWVEPKRTESLVSEVVPHLIETLLPQNFLQGRELCQSWKEELDYKNQTNPSYTSFFFEIDSGHHWDPHIRSFQFRNVLSTVESVESFMREMRNHPGNPFPSRRISLHCHLNEDVDVPFWDDNWTEYWTSAFLLLDNFGSHVHFADIWFSERDEIQPEQLAMDTLVRLRECLLRLPNLKEVVFSRADKSPFLENWIRDYYRRNPLPRLEHLEALKLTGSPALVHEVLNSCCVPAKITRLSYYHEHQYVDRGRFPEAVYSFVNLKVLRATIFFRCFERLASLERRPPLRELHLTFVDDPYFEDVFSLLENFSETLINFRTGSRIRVRNGEDFSCNLPNLKKLSIMAYFGPPELLFQFKTLNHLELFRIRDSNGEWLDEREEQFMNNSNVWTLMPRLQKLRLGCGPLLVFERPAEEQLGNGSVENSGTEGLEPRTWSQDLQLVVTEVMISLLLDLFVGSLF